MKCFDCGAEAGTYVNGDTTTHFYLVTTVTDQETQYRCIFCIKEDVEREHYGATPNHKPNHTT